MILVKFNDDGTIEQLDQVPCPLENGRIVETKKCLWCEYGGWQIFNGKLYAAACQTGDP